MTRQYPSNLVGEVYEVQSYMTSLTGMVRAISAYKSKLPVVWMQDNDDMGHEV